MQQLRFERGFTLVELMVSLVLGLLVVALVLTMFLSSIGGMSQAVTTIRLNQELRAMMDIISRDIRRAGFASVADASTNPFISYTLSGMPIEVFQSPSYSNAFNTASAGAAGDCIVMGYELDGSYRFAAYKLDGNSVRSLWTLASSPAGAGGSGVQVHCDQAGWDPLSDDDSTVITQLSFAPYPSPASYASTSVKSLIVTLSGRSVRDPNITNEIRNEIRVRSDLQ